MLKKGLLALFLLFFSFPIYADDQSQIIALLKQLNDTTTKILSYVEDIPDHLKVIATEMLSLSAEDESTETANAQEVFVKLYETQNKIAKAQVSLQPRLMQDLLNPKDAPRPKIPFVNDLSYTTLLNSLLVDPDPREKNQNAGANGNAPKIDQAYNYLKNASSINVRFIPPNVGWQGNSDDKDQYIRFFKTITSVQSFNAYVLSEIYQDFKNKNYPGGENDFRKKLLDKANSSEWFSTIATQSIGVVLRQTLIFDAQIYALLTDLLHTQKQLLQSQVMTNTLLIMMNRANSVLLVQKAQGAIPTGR